MQVYLSKKDKVALRFILGEFLLTHHENIDTYKNDIETAQKIYSKI